MKKQTRGFVLGGPGVILGVLLFIIRVTARHLLPDNILWIFLIGLGLYGALMIWLTTPSVTSSYGHRARRPGTALRDEPDDAPLLEDAAPGTCWQCGKKLRGGTSLCPACGAGQRKPRSLDDLTTGMDLPPGTFAPAPPAPMYQPGRLDPLAPPAPLFPDRDS